MEEEVLIKLENLFSKHDSVQNEMTFNNKEVFFADGKPIIVILNNEVVLTAVEYKMVKLLIQNNNKVVSREQFLNVLEVAGHEVYDRVIDVHIRNIRKKVRNIYEKELIKTVYGLGYVWAGVADE